MATNIQTRISKIEKLLNIRDRSGYTKVFAVFPDGEETYLYGYPDEQDLILKILVGSSFVPPSAASATSISRGSSPSAA